MTLRRYAPLALSALALACQPDIDQRTNASTVEYAVFNPSSDPPMIPLPNDIATSKVEPFVTGPYAGASCSLAAVDAATPEEAQQALALCAFARAGGFPADDVASIGYVAGAQISFLTGTLGGNGSVAYAPSPLDTDSLTFASIGVANTPNVAVVDAYVFEPWALAVSKWLVDGMVGAMPTPPADLIVPVTAAYASGTLTLTPDAGSWPTGHRMVVLVRGGADGVLTEAAGAYVAMPPLYILREAVIGNLDLRFPENQGLLPGTAEDKMASGTALEPLRFGYESLEQMTQLLPFAGIDMPFGELVSMQTFWIATGGTVTLADGTDANGSVTAGQVGQVDAFTLESTLSSATIAGLVFAMTANTAAADLLLIMENADCTGQQFGSISSPVLGPNTFSILDGSLALAPNVPNTLTDLYVCARTTTAGAVSGYVAGGQAFPGTNFTVTAPAPGDIVGTLTATAAP